MKNFMSGLSEKASSVAKIIGEKTEEISKKTEEVVEAQKLKSQIRGLEQNNEVDLCDLGEIIYAKFKEGEEIDEALVAICEEIKERLVTIEDLEKQVLELKGQDLCEGCGKPIDKESAFCGGCGMKIERPVVEEEDEEEVSEPIFEEGDVVESATTEDEEVEIELVVEAVTEVVEEEV